MTGKNIVVLSDGTGNSAAKITKTNVWRLYEALDLEKSANSKQINQLAFYDDGVGTGGSQFIRAIGGAFGYGMARNVRQLYAELCRHYDGNPDGSGDNIYLFGFSRGAFTVRVLSGLIRHCGIIDRESDKTIKVWRWSRLRHQDVPVASEEGLKAVTRIAYRSLRKRNDKAPVSRLYRVVRDVVFGMRTPKTEDFRSDYAISKKPRIKFLGVFDTVSAYGLPVDEMAIAIHKWIFPLRFPDNILSERVDHAYQALALDEARHTFHPVLWTERKFRPDWTTAPPDDRPKQAWFAGMHADVGGGYADDRLSFVPCLWMIEQSAATGLRFSDYAVESLRARSTEMGDVHDSRRGLAAFYRYKPRILNDLGEEDLDGGGRPEVQIDRFKIHHSVFDRIKATDADYAPAGIPKDYDVVMPPSTAKPMNVVSADDAGYEDAGQRKDRIYLQDTIADIIVRRRLIHFVMLVLALVLVALPLLWLPNPAYLPKGWLASLVGYLLWPVTFLPIPGPERISQFWAEHPNWFLLVAAGFAASWFGSAMLKQSMQKRGQQAWGHLVGRAVPKPPNRPRGIDVWRSLWGAAHYWWTKKTMPLLLVVLLFVGVPALIGLRYYIFSDHDWGAVCLKDEARQLAGEDPFTFSTQSTCVDTGKVLIEGWIYEATITVKEPWKDKSLPADPTGLKWQDISVASKALMVLGAPIRRFWSEDWFAVIGSIGRSREYAFRVDAKPTSDDPDTFTYTFKAWRGGTLYLFVNDGLFPGMDFYENNSGTAEITIKKVGEL